MPDVIHAIVLFGDVIESRKAAGRAAAWLRTLSADLDEAFAPVRLARFGFTQGDEIQGLLRVDADPFAAVVRAQLHPDAPRMRWVAVAGEVDPGRGPATQRTGAAFLAARDLLERARARRDDLLAQAGDERADRLLDNLAPLLAVLLRELSPRQRAAARLMLVDGLRQADVADRLGVSRATVSVLVDRARIREIGRLHAALAMILRDGLAARGIAG